MTPHDGIAGSGLGNTVELSVQLTVFPYPDFKWWRVTNGSADEEVSGDEFTVETTEGNSTLLIRDLGEEHFGYYKVTAFNEHGNLTDADGTDGIVFQVVPSSKCDCIYDHSCFYLPHEESLMYWSHCFALPGEHQVFTFGLPILATYSPKIVSTAPSSQLL